MTVCFRQNGCNESIFMGCFLGTIYKRNVLNLFLEEHGSIVKFYGGEKKLLPTQSLSLFIERNNDRLVQMKSICR